MKINKKTIVLFGIVVSIFVAGIITLSPKINDPAISEKGNPPLISNYPKNNELGSEMTANAVMLNKYGYNDTPYGDNLYSFRPDHLPNGFYAISNTIDLSQYVDKTVNIAYREVTGVFLSDLQLVVIDSVQ